MSSMIARHPVALARAAAILWLGVALWLYVIVSSVGQIVPVDLSGLFWAYVGPPVALFVAVLVAGHYRLVSILSIVAGTVYVVVGVMDFVRAAEFERQNPGSADAGGGFIAIVLVLLSGGAALWSLSALAGLQRLRRLASDDRSH
jgi:hypothetical protein